MAKCVDPDQMQLSVASGPKVIKLFSYSTQLSINFVLLINLKLLTIANSFSLNIRGGKPRNYHEIVLT